MTWIKIMLKISPPKKELQRFGIAMGIFFPFVFAIVLPIIFSKSFPVWPYILSILFILPALIYPQLLRPLYIVWMKFSYILGKINLHIIMTSIYLVIFTPVALYFKLIGRNSMNSDYDKNLDSYREKSFPKSKERMEKPY